MAAIQVCAVLLPQAGYQNLGTWKWLTKAEVHHI